MDDFAHRYGRNKSLPYYILIGTDQDDKDWIYIDPIVTDRPIYAPGGSIAVFTDSALNRAAQIGEPLELICLSCFFHIVRRSNQARSATLDSEYKLEIKPWRAACETTAIHEDDNGEYYLEGCVEKGVFWRSSNENPQTEPPFITCGAFDANAGCWYEDCPDGVYFEDEIDPYTIKENTPYPITYPFHAMAASGNETSLKEMLDTAGKDNTHNIINEVDHRGFTVLHKAIESGNGEIVNMLIDRGANVNAEVTGDDPEGWTAVHFAAFDNFPKIIRLLVENGADVNKWGKSKAPLTPLRIAITRDHQDSVRTLLELGADPLEINEQGFTLLHEAANIGNRECIKMMLAAGCDPRIKAKDGTTAAMWAGQFGDAELAAIIDQYKN